MPFFFLLGASFFIIPEASGEPDAKPYFTDLGQYSYAEYLMRDHDYEAAAREYGRLIANFPSSKLLSDAQFKMAEAFFNAGRFSDALTAFKMYLSNFPDAAFGIEAQIKSWEAEDRLKASEAVKIPYQASRPAAIEHSWMRAVQVMFFEGKTYRDVDQELKKLKAAGIDTVIVRAFHNIGDRYYPFARPKEKAGVYFASKHSPVVDNILPRLAESAHKNGLKIFAWMTTRYANYGVEDNPDLACRGYDIYGQRPLRCKGLDLFNEEAVRRLEGIYSELADCEIDGVLFQDDLVLRHHEGFGPRMESLFKKDTGLAISPDSLYVVDRDGNHVHYTGLFWKWAAWKNKRLLTVAERLRSVVKSKRPEAKFAINFMYESVTNPPYALAWLSQSLEEARRRNFDYYSIMAYHRQMEDELRYSPGAVKDMIYRMVEDARKVVDEPGSILVKVQTVDWKTGYPVADSEVLGIIDGIKDVNEVSLAVVPYRGDFPFEELRGKKGSIK